MKKTLEGWPSIRIHNTLRQIKEFFLVDQAKIEVVAKGNCKVYPNELPKERYDYYLMLRTELQKYHQIHKLQK